MVVPIGLEPTTSTMSRWHSTNWVTGPKRNGSISKKSLNSKQILIFRKIPPKFYTRLRRDVKRRRILREISRYCRNPAQNSIPLLKFAIPRGILSRLCATRVFRPSSLFCPVLFYLVVLHHPASFHLLALLYHVIFHPPASPPCAWLRRPNFFIQL